LLIFAVLSIRRSCNKVLTEAARRSNARILRMKIRANRQRQFTKRINYQTNLERPAPRRAAILTTALGQISDAVCPGERQLDRQTSSCLALFWRPPVAVGRLLARVLSQIF
jgi:hypothetical protein